MNCKICGTVLSPTSKFCLNCGTPVEIVPTAPNPVDVQNVPAELFTPVAPVIPAVEQQPVQPVEVTQTQPVVTNDVPAELFTPVAPVIPTVEQQPVQPVEVAQTQPVVTNDVPAELFTPVAPVIPTVEQQPVQPVEVVQAQPVATNGIPTELLEPAMPVVETQVVMPVENVQTEVSVPIEQTAVSVTPTVPTEIPGVPNPVVPDTLITPIPVTPVAPVAPMSTATPQVMEQGIIETPTEGLPVGQPVPMPEVPKTETQPVAPVVQVPVNSMPVVNTTIPVTNQQPEQPKQRDNKVLYFVIGLVIVTAIIVAILFAVFGGKDEEDGTTNNNPAAQTPVVEVPTYEYKQGKFSYVIPTKYTVQEQDGYVALYNNTYYMEFSPVEGYSFTTLTESDAKAIIENMGATVVSSKTTDSNGKTYAVVRAIYNGIECVFVIDKSTTNYAVISFGYKLNYTYDEKLETEIISIIERIKYSPSANLEPAVDIDLSQVRQ